VGSDGVPAAGAGRQVDFFVSHASRDQVWAEWLAWQLTEAGYTVELAVWDWAPGEDFLARMEAALSPDPPIEFVEDRRVTRQMPPHLGRWSLQRDHRYRGGRHLPDESLAQFVAGVVHV
jgi:TIR domain